MLVLDIVEDPNHFCHLLGDRAAVILCQYELNILWQPPGKHPAEQGGPVLTGWAQLAHVGQHVGWFLPLEGWHVQELVYLLVPVQLVQLEQLLLHLLV